MKGTTVTSNSAPAGPGLFEITRATGERAITNVRKLAGGPAAPGRALINTATVLLGLLDGGLFAVSLAAQYQYILHAKHQHWPAVIEAIALDAGMVIFSLLALGLARAGQSARIERALIVVCALGSAGMNYAAADVTSPRSVLAYTMPPVFLAIVTDRVIAVVRRHVLGMHADRSAWAAPGRATAAAARAAVLAVLYTLRLILAPAETTGGLRRMILAAAPLPPVPARTDNPYASGGPRTTAWPAVDRDAVITSLADEIRDAITAGERWQPDYPALMRATGRRRSWCEKAVRDARTAVFNTPDNPDGSPS